VTATALRGPGSGDARAATGAEPALAFALGEPGPAPGIEIHVNFGLYAGREASNAEIDRLAGWLLDLVERVTLIAATRHEVDAHSQAAVYQVRIAVDLPDVDSAQRARLERSLVERAEHWARLCIAERSAGGIEPAPSTG
jgi:hypothetical protein